MQSVVEGGDAGAGVRHLTMGGKYGNGRVAESVGTVEYARGDGVVPDAYETSTKGSNALGGFNASGTGTLGRIGCS